MNLTVRGSFRVAVSKFHGFVNICISADGVEIFAPSLVAASCGGDTGPEVSTQQAQGPCQVRAWALRRAPRAQ